MTTAAPQPTFTSVSAAPSVAVPLKKSGTKKNTNKKTAIPQTSNVTNNINNTNTDALNPNTEGSHNTINSNLLAGEPAVKG